MITLDSPVWKTLNGGYNDLYDVSVPLKKLEKITDPNEFGPVWIELWDELHHQGDVGVASYLAVPQLARIGVSKNLFDSNLLEICSAIEQRRHLGNNPKLPEEFHDYYNEGLEILKRLIIANISKQTDELTFRAALSALAVCMGHIKLSKAIGELEGDRLDEFLEQF